jgi:hypothetical protein
VADIDSTILSRVTMELMSDLEDKYGEDAQIDTVLLVAAIRTEDGNNVECLSSDDRPWVNAGLLGYAMEAAKESGDPEEAEDD